MDEARTRRFLKDETRGVLCTLGEDGFPYGVPIDFMLLQDRVCFHGRREGEKTRKKGATLVAASASIIATATSFSDGVRITAVCESIVLRGQVSR